MIGSAYIMVVIGILLAKGLGFYRDMVFAGVFGTGVEADIYFQVFGLVNLIFTGIGVALSTLVIKNLNKAENAGSERSYAAHFLRKSTVYLTLAAGLMALFARPIVHVILPEISGDYFSLAVKMMYIMAPSLVFVVIAYIISGLLQNKKAYFITSVMSLPFNAAIIVSLFFENVSILTVAAVTTLGWFLHIAIQLPSFYKHGYSFIEKSSELKSEKNKNPEILWIFISNMMFQLCIYIDRAFVSSSTGMAATFNYASNLFITISSVFIVAMSTVVFPSVSKNYEEGNICYVKDLVGYIMTVMTAIFLPFLLVAAFFGGDVIRLVYERGAFTSESTAAVSLIFFMYCLAILGYTAQELFNKVLYLDGKYKYTVSGTLAVVILNAVGDLLIKRFVPPCKVGTVSLGAVLIAAFTALLLTAYGIFIAVKMKKVIGAYLNKETLSDMAKIALSGIAAVACYIVLNFAVPEFTHGYITFIAPLLACGAVYVAFLCITGVLGHIIKREKKGGQAENEKNS